MNTPALIARLQSVVALGTTAATALLAHLESLPGFGFRETMTGTIQLATGAPRRIRFRLRAAVPQLVAYLRDGRTAVVGDITIDGLAEAAPLTGSLWIWPHRSIIRYALAFRADDGQELRLSGQKDIRLLAFRRTITTLPATLQTAEGEPLGNATVYFALADLPSFVRSFHPVHLPGSADAANDDDDDGAADVSPVPGACPAPSCHP